MTQTILHLTPGTYHKLASQRHEAVRQSDDVEIHLLYATVKVGKGIWGYPDSALLFCETCDKDVVPFDVDGQGLDEV